MPLIGSSSNRLGLLNHTKSVPGRRLLQSWLKAPFCDRTEINKRLDYVEALIPIASDKALAKELSDCLAKVHLVNVRSQGIILDHYKL